MVEAFKYESFEGEVGPQTQSQGQVQSQSGNGQQSQGQMQAQNGNGSQVQVQGQSQGSGNSETETVNNSTHPVEFHKIMTFLFVALFLVITVMIESSSGNPMKKLRMMLSSSKFMVILLIILFFYGYVFFMKFRPNVSKEQYDKYLVTERHANVALIIIFCEMIGLRLSSYWLVWAATYLNL